MKNLFTNLTIFLLLTLVLSIFTACENPKTTETSDDAEMTEASNETWTESEKSKEDNKADDKQYPPAPKVIAMAEFEFLDGTTFKLEENKGKVVLFNLWAIWCAPCIQEMPHLNELHEKFKDDGLVIVGVNIGNDYGEKKNESQYRKLYAK